MVVPSTAARTPKPIPRMVMPARPLHSAQTPTPTPTASTAPPEPKPIKIVTSYAFAAKPRDSEMEEEDMDTGNTDRLKKSRPRILRGGILPNSDLEKWRYSMLNGGDACLLYTSPSPRD